MQISQQRGGWATEKGEREKGGGGGGVRIRGRSTAPSTARYTTYTRLHGNYHTRTGENAARSLPLLQSVHQLVPYAACSMWVTKPPHRSCCRRSETPFQTQLTHKYKHLTSCITDTLAYGLTLNILLLLEGMTCNLGIYVSPLFFLIHLQSEWLGVWAAAASK